MADTDKSQSSKSQSPDKDSDKVYKEYKTQDYPKYDANQPVDLKRKTPDYDPDIQHYMMK